MTPVLYVGQQVADELLGNLEDNLGRYREGDFSDLVQSGNWGLELSVRADITRLDGLSAETGATGEVANSMLVGSVLQQLTPTLAREERLWIRLSHVECLEYSRKRWLKEGASDESLLKDVEKHFFARGITGCRDYHAVSRLWWNHHIAQKIMPDDPERALNNILARADIRSNLVERPGLGARPVLARAIVCMLEDESNGLKAGESLFRSFMKQVNLQGAGIVFEVWGRKQVSDFLKHCLDVAQQKS